MTHFPYIDGQLHVEEVPLRRIAEQIGTPFYCYSTVVLTDNYQAYVRTLGALGVNVFYSLKANSNQAVIRTLGRLGAGADVVSVGEMHRALKAGIPADKIVFAGVGKTELEMEAALAAGIYQFNVESFGELETLSDVAVRMGVTAPVTLRINPDVDAKTHAKISTGKAENKFGIDIDHAAQLYSAAARMKGIRILGLAVHIGSQLTDIAPYRAAFAKIAELARTLRKAGLTVERIDLGGGIGISYRDEPTIGLEDYAVLVKELIVPLGTKIEIEPGRSIVGNAGLLVARVINVKEGVSRKFVIVDAAMNDLIRPSLYDAYHGIIPVAEPAKDARIEPCDVVGPICETGDRFAEQRPLPPVKPGDLVAFETAGAYGSVMSSTYNTRLPAAEVLVRGDRYDIVRPRPSYDHIIDLDKIPDWLS
ncbi:MAG TPA: diaminopimelate decarboxylase [Dongiaceae bacterium]|jgi:diaminopimelate decarboxylase|nr:diaminopimelate decarboxylase [Dongiaceae bacterium]